MCPFKSTFLLLVRLTCLPICLIVLQDGDVKANAAEIAQINASREILRRSAETASNVVITKDINVALNELMKKYRQSVQQAKRFARNSLIFTQFDESGSTMGRSAYRLSMSSGGMTGSGLSASHQRSSLNVNRRSFAMGSHYAA